MLNPPPATADTATVAAGHALYGQYCGVCHGENAVGGGVVPDLRASSFLGNDFFYEIVLNGAMKDAGMAPFSPRTTSVGQRTWSHSSQNERTALSATQPTITSRSTR